MRTRALVLLILWAIAAVVVGTLLLAQDPEACPRMRLPMDLCT